MFTANISGNSLTNFSFIEGPAVRGFVELNGHLPRLQHPEKHVACTAHLTPVLTVHTLERSKFRLCRRSCLSCRCRNKQRLFAQIEMYQLLGVVMCAFCGLLTECLNIRPFRCTDSFVGLRSVHRIEQDFRKDDCKLAINGVLPSHWHSSRH